MQSNQELFPKELITHDEDGQLLTSSLMVAQYFGKRHKHILRDIERLRGTIPDPGFSWTNFGPIPYLDSVGRVQLMYRLTKDGFYMLTMGFTGKKALEWKVKFINAFNQMETQLNEQLQREADALNHLRPKWRLISDGLDKNLSRKEICVLTGYRSPNSVTAAKKRMREAGVLTVFH